MDENRRKACIAIILAFSIPSKRITNRKRWVKEWISKRKKYCHLNLLKEIQLSDQKDYQNCDVNTDEMSISISHYQYQ